MEIKIHEDNFFALFLEYHSKIAMIILFWVENLKKSQSSDQNCARLLKILQIIGLESKINFWFRKNSQKAHKIWLKSSFLHVLNESKILFVVGN